MLRFDDRVAVVTGAGSGLGRSHAGFLAERGAKVVAVGRASSFGRVEQTCDVINAAGGEALAVAATVGDAGDAEALVARVIEAFGRIDIVINNAGDAVAQVLVPEAPGDSLERMLDVHVRGPLQINRAAWPHMERQVYGRLLFTGSANGTGWMKGARGYELDYAAAKSALFAVTRQTAAAGAAVGIKANMVMPWAFTDGVAARHADTPLGQWMKANLRSQQVSAAVAVLCHEDCPVSGEFIAAQGGRVARVFFAATRGYFDPQLTPEAVQANWEAVIGRTADDGTLLDAFEQTQPREQRLIAEMADTQVLPDLAWLARQPLDAMNLPPAATDSSSSEPPS